MTIGTILLIYHLAFNPVDIFNPIGLAGVFLLSWFTGVAIGMVFFGVNTMAPATRENSFDGLSSGEHAWHQAKCSLPIHCHPSCWPCLIGTLCFTVWIKHAV